MRRIPPTSYDDAVSEGASTNTDVGDRTGWAIDDRVVRLRVWGDDTCYQLPSGPRVVIGAAPDCDIQLQDPLVRVSRHHAEIVDEAGNLVIRDLQSTNGIRLDHELRLSFHVTPAVEIEIASVRLIAESPRSIALHALLARVLGWAPTRRADVDTALRAVRGMATLRAPLLLRGAGDLARIAHRLHAHTLGHLPFVDTSSGADPEPSFRTGGMVFVDAARPKVDLRMLVAGIRTPGARVRAIVAADTPKAAAEAMALFPGIVPVVVPPLSGRRTELMALMHGFAADAVARWGLPGSGLHAKDEERVARLELESLGDLEELIERVVSARNGGITIGAARLGISHVSLGRWLRAREIPI